MAHHEHDDGSDHERGDGHDSADYFDQRARDWDDAGKVERARVVAVAIRAVVDVDDTTRLLEYGAGTGLATEHLAVDGIGPVTLAEPSAGMREVIGDKVTDGRLPADAVVLDLDLADDEAPDTAPDTAFDLVLTVMTLHHIPDVDRVMRGFAALVAPGGRLCIVDLVAEDGSFHQHLDDFDGHDGFTRAGLASTLTAAGFAEPTWEVVHHLDKDGATYPLFLATARPA